MCVGLRRPCRCLSCNRFSSRDTPMQPLSRTTRHLQNSTLIVTVLAILIVNVGLVPKNWTALGVDFQDRHQASLLAVLACLQLYLVTSFLANSANDLRAVNGHLTAYAGATGPVLFVLNLVVPVATALYGIGLASYYAFLLWRNSSGQTTEAPQIIEHLPTDPFIVAVGVPMTVMVMLVVSRVVTSGRLDWRHLAIGMDIATAALITVGIGVWTSFTKLYEAMSHPADPTNAAKDASIFAEDLFRSCLGLFLGIFVLLLLIALEQSVHGAEHIDMDKPIWKRRSIIIVVICNILAAAFMLCTMFLPV